LKLPSSFNTTIVEATPIWDLSRIFQETLRSPGLTFDSENSGVNAIMNRRPLLKRGE
jgi:hypothetical protein